LHNYDEALKNLYRALEIKQSLSLNLDNDRNLAVTQCTIEKCLTMLQQYDNSWIFQQSLKVFQSTTTEVLKDISIANTLNCMGKCLMG